MNNRATLDTESFCVCVCVCLHSRFFIVGRLLRGIVASTSCHDHPHYVCMAVVKIVNLTSQLFIR